MTGTEVIAQHLGGVFITDEMKETADRALGRIGWILSWRKGHREIWYECCGRTLIESETNDMAEGYALSNAEHRKKGTCPYCSSVVKYINKRWIKEDDYTEVYTVWHRMSQTEPNTLLVLGMWSGRRWFQAKYGTDPKDIQTEHEACSLVVLPWDGKPQRYIRECMQTLGSYNRWFWGCGVTEDQWSRRRDVEGGDRQSLNGNDIDYLVCTSLQGTVRGTRWEKPARFTAECRNITNTRDGIKLLEPFCRHPQMEYMIGNGMQGILTSCISHDGTMSLIRWKKRKPADMFGLDPNEMARLRRMKPDQTNGKGLLILRKARELGQRVKLEEAMEVAKRPQIAYTHTKSVRGAINAYGKRWGVMKIMRYCSRNHGMLSLWMDHMRDLQRLGEQNTEELVFPRDLYERHAQMQQRIRYQTDEETDAKVVQRAETLKKLTFEACGLRLSPFESPKEIIREGTEQIICIGSYIRSYANGNTVLLKLRRIEEPDKPFHAVEMNNDGKTLVQCRGYKNKTFPEDEAVVRNFWKAWDEAYGTTTRVYLTIHKEASVA